MALKFEFPHGAEPLDYLVSFAPAFANDDKMHSALLGMRDSLRQADLIRLEPLCMLACLTAEEEAAAFLYYALLAKGYPVPNYGRLHRHDDKINVLIVALTLYEYFFGLMPVEFPRRIRLERDGDLPRTTLRMAVQDYDIIVEDPLEAIATIGDCEAGHDAAVAQVVQDALAKVIPKEMDAKSQIKKLANRKNLCLYGDPERKHSFQEAAEMDQFTSNCISITLIGFLVHNGSSRTSSMVKLIRAVFEKLAVDEHSRSSPK